MVSRLTCALAARHGLDAARAKQALHCLLVILSADPNTSEQHPTGHSCPPDTCSRATLPSQPVTHCAARAPNSPARGSLGATAATALHHPAEKPAPAAPIQQLQPGVLVPPLLVAILHLLLLAPLLLVALLLLEAPLLPLLLLVMASLLLPLLLLVVAPLVLAPPLAALTLAAAVAVLPRAAALPGGC